MRLPMYDEIHLPLLKLINDCSVYRVKEAVKALSQEFNLTEEAMNKRVPSGSNKFYSQVSFSKKRLIEAGLIFAKVSPYRTTELGKELLASNPKKISNSLINHLIKNGNLGEEKIVQGSPYTTEEYLHKIREINENDPNFFEYISGLILSNILKEDFKKVVFTPQNNDGGIDGFIKLRINDETICFESKCKMSRPVAVGNLRDFIGALVLRKSKQGYYFTTTRYTGDVIRAVNKLKSLKIDINIELIDGDTLVNLLLKYNLENEIRKTVSL
jgi:restriction system protein